MLERWSTALLILGSLALLSSQPSSAQLRNAPEPETGFLNVDNQPYKENKNANLILIEFADYQCTFCGRHFRETEPQLERDYVKTGKVKFVFWDFPLKSHKDAFKAAEAARCASDQGKYWAMHDRLFANQQSLGLHDLVQHARAIGLDPQNFKLCLDSGKHAAEVSKGMDEATKLGVKVTPTFFLGFAEPGSPKVKTQKTIVGAKPYADFKEAIDTLLGVR